MKIEDVEDLRAQRRVHEEEHDSCSVHHLVVEAVSHCLSAWCFSVDASAVHLELVLEEERKPADADDCRRDEERSREQTVNVEACVVHWLASRLIGELVGRRVGVHVGRPVSE